MRVIAFTGLPGSGKSEAIAVARQMKLPVVRMGDFVLQEVRDRGLPEEERHIGPLATGMREQQGQDVWARRTLQAIRSGEVPGISRDTSLVVIDGVRSPAEADRFRQELGTDFLLVSIDAAPETRHQRILGRGRSDDSRELELVRARDEREKSWGLEEAIQQAEHHIANEGSRDELHARVRALLEGLRTQA